MCPKSKAGGNTKPESKQPWCGSSACHGKPIKTSLEHHQLGVYTVCVRRIVEGKCFSSMGLKQKDTTNNEKVNTFSQRALLLIEWVQCPETCFQVFTPPSDPETR